MVAFRFEGSGKPWGGNMYKKKEKHRLALDVQRSYQS